MNKTVFSVIIGLMTAAMLGIAGLQVYWISWSIKLNEVQFDKNVFAALNRVAERIKEEEITNALNILKNTDEASDLLNDEAGKKVLTEFQSYSVEAAYEKYITQDTSTYLAREFGRIFTSNQCSDPNCKTCRFKRQQNLLSYVMLKNEFIPRPMADRINLASLDNFLHQEMDKIGEDVQYHYGVFDNDQGNFIVKDSHFEVTASSPEQSKVGGQDPLLVSKYRVGMFTDSKLSGQPPGFLVIYFPAKTSLLWASVWQQLAASIFFIGLIVFCFVYVIQVIFRQKKLSEMKNDFINNMTHEFKTPIATISLAADSITSPMVLANPDKIRRFADIIRQENKRMNSQVEKVLQMAVIDRNEFQLKLSRVNLHELIEQAVQNFSLQVEKRGGVIITHLDAANPVIEADATHLSNIIHNLMDNANKYTPENPEITLTTRNVPHGIELSVKDNGVGIGKEARKYIFDRFYRVHTGNVHDVKGFGLGLSYVKAMMVAHKGQIDLKSEPGKGSTFILTFPFTVHTETRPSTAE